MSFTRGSGGRQSQFVDIWQHVASYSDVAVETRVHPRYLALCVLCILPAGCVPGADTVDPALAQNGAPLGYRYHDANHADGVKNPSPQAIYNATHGTWLWPPQESDVP